MNQLFGAGVALVTPFHSDGTIDFESLAKLIEHQIKGGMDYLVVLGTTGETATLSAEERDEIWSFTARVNAGRLPLVAGIGGNHTAEIVKAIRNFKHEGYFAILSVSPYYNKPTQEGIYQHYKAVAEATQLPIILYNVPGRTGSNMTPETTLRLAREFKNIVAIKEASGSFDQFSKILRDKPKDFLLISGDDPVTLPMVALGAAGVISVIGNAFPRQVADLASLSLSGEFKAARQIHEDLIRPTELCFVEGNPAGIKEFLQLLEITSTTVRLPLTPVSETTRHLIKEAFDILLANETVS